MSEAFLIMLREGFEASLVVAIVFTYLQRIDRNDLRTSAWFGVAAAVLVAVAVGVGIHLTVGELEGAARLRAFAAISIVAAAVLTWMIFWMRTQSRAIRGHLQEKIDLATAGDGAATGVLLVAFAAVVREGIEAALFIVATTTEADSNDVLIGAVAGLLAAVVLGLAVYVGGRKLPLGTFFKVTGVILILFAAGLCAKAVMFLQAAGDLGSLNDAVYNLTAHAWLTSSTETGRFLAGLLGWDPRPSIEQVAVWLLYTLPVLTLFLMDDPAPTKAPPASPAPDQVPTGQPSSEPVAH
jgi:high-affinity iron transporter